MKTIIAGTDFTPSSVNACRYAAFLAQKLNCKLTLFNMFEAPIVHSNVGLYGFTYTSARHNSLQKTDKLARELSKKFPKLQIEQFITNGNFKSELETFTSKHQVEAAVMGLEAKDRISKFIYGSRGVNIAGKINTPVIIVPQNYKTHNLSKIVLAVDSSEKLHQASLSHFSQFISEAKASLSLLHVKTPDEFYAPVIKALKVNDKNLPVKVSNEKNIESGVKKYYKTVKADMVGIISKKHSAFYNFFFESNTKKIAFAVKVPVIAIHE